MLDISQNPTDSLKDTTDPQSAGEIEDLDQEDVILLEDSYLETTMFLKTVMWWLLGMGLGAILAMFVVARIATAAPNKWFGAEHVSVDTWKIALLNDPYKPEYTEYWRAGGSFNFDLRMLKLFKWQNKLHMDGVDARIARAGWEFSFIMDYFETVKPFYYHHSEHSMDQPGAYDLSEWGYPATDKYGLNFCAIGCSKNHRENLP